MKGSAEIVSTFYWAWARFCYGHATILTPIFKAGFARAHHTPAEPFLDTSMKTVSCSKLQGIYVSQGYILANFFTASSFCSVRGRGFVKMQETLQIWRVQLKSHAYHKRAHSLTTAQYWLTVYLHKTSVRCKKPVWRHKTGVTSPEIWTAATSKKWHDFCRVSLSPPWRSRRALLAGCTHSYSCVQTCK